MSVELLWCLLVVDRAPPHSGGPTVGGSEFFNRLMLLEIQQLRLNQQSLLFLYLGPLI